MIEIKKEKKIWENYVGLIQVEVKHTYPELYTAGAVLVQCSILNLQIPNILIPTFQIPNFQIPNCQISNVQIPNIQF